MSRFGWIKCLSFALVFTGTLLVLARAEFRTLPLPYSVKSLEPHLSAKTMEIHHEDHYRKHVETLNKMLRTIERLEGSSLEEIMLDAYPWNKPLYNHAAQVWNHQFYFNCMTSVYDSPSDSLVERITKDFGSFDGFKTAFRKAGNSAQGSGWAWLVYHSLTGKLIVTTTIGADNPIVQNENYWPILTMDVWEHAYYLDYRNRRKDYTKAFVNSLVDWRFVEETLSRVEVEAVTAAERREKARLEKEAAKKEREKLEAREAADFAKIETRGMVAEANAVKEETGRLAIEAADTAGVRDESIEVRTDAEEQQLERLHGEAISEVAMPLQEEIDGDAATLAREKSGAETVAIVNSPGMYDEKEVQANKTEEIVVKKESSPEVEDEGIESRSMIWRFPGHVYRLIFGKTKATTQEENIAVDISPPESRDIEKGKPEKVIPAAPQTLHREEVKENNNPFVLYAARLGTFVLGILRFILRVLHLILRIIFM